VIAGIPLKIITWEKVGVIIVNIHAQGDAVVLGFIQIFVILKERNAKAT
jgi:hypothetical protein